MTIPTTKPKKPRSTTGAAVVGKRKADWEAVERDYRTGKFTLRELETKHHVSIAQISRKASSLQWTKDLRQAIRQATDAALLHESVTEAQKNVTDTIVVAAEVAKNVILGHRTRLVDLAGAVDAAKAKLLVLGDSVADIREAATFVQAVGNLATATKTLIEQERKAFNLDEEKPPESDPLSTLLGRITGGNTSTLKPVAEDPDHDEE